MRAITLFRDIYLAHPDEGPEYAGPSKHLCILNPSRMRSNARWIAFRDNTLRAMVQSDPEDREAIEWIKQVDKILEWRATIPPDKRFWEED